MPNTKNKTNSKGSSNKKKNISNQDVAIKKKTTTNTSKKTSVPKNKKTNSKAKTSNSSKNKKTLDKKTNISKATLTKPNNKTVGKKKLENKTVKKTTVLDSSVKLENKHRKISLANIFNLKFKNNKSKDIKIKDSKKNVLKNSTPLLSKKSKKWLIIVAVICLVVILLELGYFIYSKVLTDSRKVYYDSLNALIIDNTDVVAVGSSNFKYSKYNSYTNGLEKAKLVKYDQNGKIIFEKMYKNGINTTFSSVANTDDGYIVVGSGVFSKEEQESEAREAFIIKYDKDGNIIWEKYYQVVTNTRFNKVIVVDDGYVAIGQSIYANMEMGNHTTGGGIIVKYDLDGNEIWHNNHGGMKSGNFNDIVQVNGDYYVVGKDATDSANLVKFSSSGQYLWHKNYSYTDSLGFSGIAYLDNYLYVVGSKKILAKDVGENDNRDTTNTDALLIKYDLDGNVVFEKTFGGSNYERYNSILSHRSNLYVVGHITSSDAGFKMTTDGKTMTGFVARYDTDGNITKKEIFGGSNNDNLTDIVTDGGSLYISGYSNSDNGNIVTSKDNGKDYFGKVIKIDYRFRTLMIK